MIPTEILRTLRSARIDPQVWGTYRSAPSYDRLNQQQVREADLETLMAGGLAEDIERGAGRILEDTGRYVFFARLKTASNAPFDTMINSFPHRDYPIAHTLDELPPEEQQIAFDLLERTTNAVIRVAQKYRRPLKRTLIEQHLGPREVNHMEFYRTAYPQAHFHVYGVPVDFPGQKDGFHPSSLTRMDRTTFFDPTIFLAWDIITKLFPEKSFKLNKSTSSIELSINNLHLFSVEMRAFITMLMSLWKDNWRQIASCFTDFTLDKNDRYSPLPKDIRLERTENYLANHRFFGTESQAILNWLADSLQPADFSSERSKLSHFFKGIAGSWGVIKDFARKEKWFIFSPRTWVMSQRGGSTDGHLINQDRTRWINDGTKTELIRIQKELISTI